MVLPYTYGVIFRVISMCIINSKLALFTIVFLNKRKLYERFGFLYYNAVAGVPLPIARSMSRYVPFYSLVLVLMDEISIFTNLKLIETL